MSAEEKVSPKSWYAQHPLVSTFLWVLGNSSTVETAPELTSQHGSSSRLHWKDELDGDICSVIEEGDANSSSSGSRKSIERQGSGTSLKRCESGKISSFNPESRIFQNSEREYGSDSDSQVTESPQWGWYVSTTPPSRDHRQMDENAVEIVTKIRDSYYQQPPK